METYSIQDIAVDAGSLEDFYDSVTEFEQPYDVAQLLKPDASSASINNGEFYINPGLADRELFLHKQAKKNDRPVEFIRKLGYDRHRETGFTDLIEKKRQSGPFKGRDRYELGGKLLGKAEVLAGVGGFLGELAGHETGVAGGALIAGGAGTLYASHEYGWGADQALNARIEEMVDQEYAEALVDARGEIPVKTTDNVPEFEDEDTGVEHFGFEWEKQRLKSLNLR